MLIYVCVKNKSSGNKPLSNLMAETLRAWGGYVYYRSRIPFESGWYRSVVRHKRWLLAQEMEVTLALNTQTTLQMELRKNRNWIEDELLAVLEVGIIALLSRHDVAAVQQRLLEASNLVGGLARELDTTNLRSFQALAWKIINQWSKTSEKERELKTTDNEREVSARPNHTRAGRQIGG
jgi:hypothetical protein